MGVRFNQMLIDADLTHSELCSILVEWECRRRGATVTRVGPLLFSATLDGVSVAFQRSVGPGIPVPAERMTRNKHATKIVLRQAGFPVPDGLRLDRQAYPEALSFAQDKDFRVVLKPVGSAGGSGVVTEIRTADDLEGAWERLMASRLSRRGIIIEDRLEGHDYRIFVVGGAVVAALSRRPARVVGDGRSTIQTLIDRKNEARGSNPDLKARPVVIDFIVQQNLASAGVGLDSILEQGRELQLRKAANLSKGGESIDVTDDVHPGFRQVAVDAVAAIPGGLAHCTVDLIAPTLTEDPASMTYGINELEGDPGMGIHHFPSTGAARDVAASIVAHYYPEPGGHRPRKVDHASLDEAASLDMLSRCLDGLSQQLGRREDDPPPPHAGDGAGRLSGLRLRRRRARKRQAVRLIIQGEVQGVGFREWIAAQAGELALDGWVRNRTVRAVEVVVAGDPAAVEAMTGRCQVGPDAAEVRSVDRKDIRVTLQDGFERRRSAVL